MQRLFAHYKDVFHIFLQALRPSGPRFLSPFFSPLDFSISSRLWGQKHRLDKYNLATRVAICCPSFKADSESSVGIIRYESAVPKGHLATPFEVMPQLGGSETEVRADSTKSTSVYRVSCQCQAQIQCEI